MPLPKEREDDPWSRSLLATPTPSDEPEDDFEPPHLNGAFIELSRDTDLAAELDLSRREDRAVVRETPFTLANLRAAASGKGKSQAKDAGEGRRPRYGGNIATADSLLEPNNRPAQAAGAGPSQAKRDWKNDSGWTDSGGNPLPHCPPSKKGKRKAEEGSTRVIQPTKSAKRQTTLFNSVAVPSNTNGTKTAKRPVARNNPNPQPAKAKKKKKDGEDKIEFRRLPTISDNREFPIVAGLERQRSLPTKSPGPKPKAVPKSKPAAKKGKFVPPAPAPPRQTKLDIDALVGGISARANKSKAIKPRKTVVGNNSQGSSSSSGGGDAIDRLLGIGKYEASQLSHPVGGHGPAPSPSYLQEQTTNNDERLDDEPPLIRGKSTVPADLLETPPTPPYAPPNRSRSIDSIPKAPSIPQSLPPIVRPTPVREISVVEMLEAMAESGFDGSTLPNQGTSQAQEPAFQVPNFNGQAYHNIPRPRPHSPILHYDGHDGHIHQRDQLSTGYGSQPQPHVLDSRAPYTPLSPQFEQQRSEYSQRYQQTQPSIPHRFSQPPQHQQGVPNSASPPAVGTYHSFSQRQEQQPHLQSQQSQHFRQSEPSRGSTPQVQATPLRLNAFAYNSSQSQPSRPSQPVRSALRHWHSLLDKPTPDDTDWSTLPKRGTRLTIRPDQPKTSGRFKLPLEVFDRPKPAGRTSYSSLSISEPNRRNAEAEPSHADDYSASGGQPHPPPQQQSTGVKLTVWTPTPMRHNTLPQPNKYVPPHIRVLEQAASESSDEYGNASTPGSSTMRPNAYASAPGPSTVRANPYPTPAHTHVHTQQTQPSQQGSDDDWTAVWGRSANVASTIAREDDQM